MSGSTRLETVRLDQLIARGSGDLDAYLRGVAQEIVNEIVLSFGSSPPGRTYDNHTASQPGYPPNVDTGALRASIRWAKTGRLEYTIFDGVPYGVLLEFGTPRVRARPFVRPVFERWRTRLPDDMRSRGII